MVRHTALMALKARSYQDNNRNRKKFIRRIYKEAEYASWILNALNTFAKDKNMFLIEKALNDELNRAIQRILALLSIIYPQEYISEAERNLKHSLPEKRAYALEVIENLIDSNLKKIVFPLLDEFSLKKRLELLQQQFRQEYLEIDRQLEAILELEPTRITIWTQVVALYYIGLRRCGSAASLSARKPATENPLFQETLDWAVARLEP